MNRVVATVGLLALSLAGCAQSGFVGRPGLEVVTTSELPPPATIDLIGKERPYLIGPLDQVSIEVYGIPDLTRSIQVDASGRVQLPLAGALVASGKTPAELAQAYEAALSAQYVRNPQVTVNLTETVSQVVTVEGAVQRPGISPISGRMTLVRAIAQAGGLTEFAKDQQVVIMRTVNDRQMAGLYDLGAIKDGVYSDPEIYPNDVVLVGESPAKRTLRNLLTASGALAAPLVAIFN